VSIGASRTALNVTSSTLVKGPLTGIGEGRIFSFNVTTAGAAGAIYDSPTTAAVAAGNLICVIPATVGVYSWPDGFPFQQGLVVVPGAAQVVSLSFR